MRKIEFVQSGYNGGFPDDSGTFHHGEPLWLVAKSEVDPFFEAALEYGQTLWENKNDIIAVRKAELKLLESAVEYWKYEKLKRKNK